MTHTMSLASALLITLALIALPGCQSAQTTGELPALGALPDDATHARPLNVGDDAPAVTVRDIENRRVKMADVYRAQPTVLVFYRGGWCPFCTRHLAELGAIQSDLNALGFQIVGVSPDRPEKLRESVAEHDLTYTILSDSDARLMRASGVAFRVDDETNDALRGYGIDLEDASGRSHRVLPVPTVYLIDTDGVIRSAHWDPDYRQRISGVDVLRAAREMTR